MLPFAAAGAATGRQLGRPWRLLSALQGTVPRGDLSAAGKGRQGPGVVGSSLEDPSSAVTEVFPLQPGQGPAPACAPSWGLPGGCLRSPTVWSEGLEAQLPLGACGVTSCPQAAAPTGPSCLLEVAGEGQGGPRRPPRGPHGARRAAGARPLTALSCRFSRSDDSRDTGARCTRA